MDAWRRGAGGRTTRDTRERILDVALQVLGRSPDAGMGEIAASAGVVRRTVYGHFPSRGDLVRALTRRAVDEIAGVLAAADVADRSADRPADAVWGDFVAQLWPLSHRYRVLLALRRGEHGEEIHAALASVDRSLADLVRRGQADGAFGRHLPPEVLSQVAFSAVFAIADADPTGEELGAAAAAVSSLLLLGVPEARARSLGSRARGDN